MGSNVSMIIPIESLKQHFNVTAHSLFRVQIGAPRGNDTKLYPGVIEPGVVFRCPIAESCHTVKFDTARKFASKLIIDHLI